MSEQIQSQDQNKDREQTDRNRISDDFGNNKPQSIYTNNGNDQIQMKLDGSKPQNKQEMLDKSSKIQNKQELINQSISGQVSCPNRIFGKLFRDFSVNTVTFHIFAINCVMWIIQLYLYYHILFQQMPNNLSDRQQDEYMNQAWNCILLRLNGKSQPQVLYLWQFWRVVLCGFIFNSWLQFYFNNFAFNMLGYSLQKQNRSRMLICFFSAMIIGNMFSSCFGPNDRISTGISCGTIGLLPIQIIRYFRLRITNPLLASKRLRFIILVLVFNFILNILALFGVGKVDWMAHLGSVISSILTMFLFRDIFEVFCPHILTTRGKLFTILQGVAIFCLVGIISCLVIYGYIFLSDSPGVIKNYEDNTFMCAGKM